MESKKIFPLLIIIVLATPALLAVKSISAATNPSIPQFNVQYVDHSYNVPPVYGTDPYTGQTVMKSGGYRVDNRTVDITITNEPFIPYKDPSSNNTVNFFYNVRSKGHFEDWNTATSIHIMSGLQASSSGYTLISFDIGYWNVPQGGQIDFQVQAVLSYVQNSYNGGCLTGSNTIVVAQSNWSPAQTLMIGTAVPASATTPPISIETPDPTISPYFPPINPTEQPAPTVTISPAQNPTETPTSNQPNTGKAVLFGFDWDQTALLVMVAAQHACILFFVQQPA
ncbi:MAG TPA: hypothetical protein VK253_08490, partial [Candidatus Binatia bacterium]|nr:hypothetical protein [Candidatus Binatia bacterium]